jgi:Zn-dependent protease with chaperone function
MVSRAVPVLSAVIHFAAAFLLMALANWAGLIPWKRAANAHWTERARLLWPVRFTAGISVFVLPFILNQVHWYLFPYNSSNWIWDCLAGFFGAMLGCFPLDRQIYSQLDFRNWRRQVVAWWGVRFGIWVVLMAACLLMPQEFGWQMLLVVAGFLLVHCLLNWGLFLKYLRLVKFLKPASQRLQQIVDATTAKMGNVQVRAAWQLGGSMATAFAFPVTRELVFSEKTLEICSDEEIAAICAHEVAHLKESKFILSARLLGSLCVFPLIFINPAVHWFGSIGVFLPFLLMLPMLRFVKWLSQRMEKRADELALKEQINEGVYARALEKLYRENLSPAVNVNNRQTHPHLYDRMIAAGITPDFPRPARPKRLTLIGWAFIFAFGLFIALTFAYDW